MEEKKEELEKVEHICNLCGLSCTLNPGDEFHSDTRAGLIDAVVSGGYESTPGNGEGALDDMTTYKFSLCEFCIDWLFSKFKIPVKMIDYGCNAPIDKPWRSASERVAKDDWRTLKKEFNAEFRRHNEARGAK